MSLLNTSSRYGVVSQLNHWTTVVLVIALIITGKAGDIEAEQSGNALYYWHSSLGVLVFLLVLARIVWFVVTPPPRLPQTASSFTRRFARSVHVLFYVLLLALPLSGWLVASAEGGSVSFFGFGTLPVGPVNQSAEEFYEELHEVLGNVLLILAILHALAALKHHLVNKDDVLMRMLPRRKRPGEA